MWKYFVIHITRTDVDDNGKKFPLHSMEYGEFCGEKFCPECARAKYSPRVSYCYGALIRSRTKHYAKYKVARQFSA